jgi:hypothetical protein
VQVPVPVAQSGQWYDLSVSASLDPTMAHVGFYRRMMGRMESGMDTVSDPAMAQHVPPAAGALAGLRGQRHLIYPIEHPEVAVCLHKLTLRSRLPFARSSALVTRAATRMPAFLASTFSFFS